MNVAAVLWRNRRRHLRGLEMSEMGVLAYVNDDFLDSIPK